MKYIPWGIPANIITIISNLFIYVAFVLSYSGPSSKLNFIVIPILIIAYLIGDHLDGMQAKRTGTGSALGEFCDHYLDAFNNGLLLIITFNIFGINNNSLMVAIVIISYLAHTSVFYEQFITKWLIFEKIGSLESVLVIAFLIFTGYFEDIYTFLTGNDYLLGFNLLEIALSLSAAGAMITFIKTASRTKNKSFWHIMFWVLLIVVGIISARTFQPQHSLIFISLYASFYIGSIMRGHLADGFERPPDLFIPLLLIFMEFSDKLNGLPYEMVFYIILGYLLLRILSLIFGTFRILRIFWVWKNPKQLKEIEL